MALTLVDRGEKLRSETLCVNFLSLSLFPVPILVHRWSEKCVTKGSKYGHWIGLYLISVSAGYWAHLFMIGFRICFTFGHDITSLSFLTTTVVFMWFLLNFFTATDWHQGNRPIRYTLFSEGIYCWLDRVKGFFKNLRKQRPLGCWTHLFLL